MLCGNIEGKDRFSFSLLLCFEEILLFIRDTYSIVLFKANNRDKIAYEIENGDFADIRIDGIDYALWFNERNERIIEIPRSNALCVYIYISTLKLGDASRRISYIEDKIRIFEFEKRSKAIDDLIGMIIFSKLLFF